MALRSARITQGLSLINHFLGSVLGSAELEDRPQDTHVRLSGRGALDSWLSYVRNGNIGGLNPTQLPSQDSNNRSHITPLRATPHIQNSAATNETIRRALRAADIDDAQIQRLLSPITTQPASNNAEPTAQTAPSSAVNRKRKQSEANDDNEVGQSQGESSNSAITNADNNKKTKVDDDSSKGKQKKD
jgi:hypothetical protein